MIPPTLLQPEISLPATPTFYTTLFSPQTISDFDL